MPLKIEWKKSTKKDLRKIPPAIAAKVIGTVEVLAKEPFRPGVEKLAGTDFAYRVRLGDYRIIYEVVPEAGLLEVQRVRHRKDVYRK